MTRNDIIYMAREAGFLVPTKPWKFERFAALVAAAEREAIIAKNAPAIKKANAYIRELENQIRALGDK